MSSMNFKPICDDYFDFNNKLTQNSQSQKSSDLTKKIDFFNSSIMQSSLQSLEHKLLLITGNDFNYYNLTKDELDNNFIQIGNGEKSININELVKQKENSVAVITAHGFLSKRKNGKKFDTIANINLISNLKSTASNIITLQKMLGIRHFYLFTCHGGALANSTAELEKKLKPGTTITIFCSLKDILLNVDVTLMIRKIVDFYKTHRDLSAKEIDEKFFEENMLFAPSTSIRIEITYYEQFDLANRETRFFKGAIAFKVRGPKQPIDLKDCSQYVFSARKIKPLFNTDRKCLNVWLQKSTNTKKSIDLESYKNRALIDCAYRNKSFRVKMWIEHGGVCVNLNTEHVTALSKACSRNNLKSVKVLLAAGADPNLSDNCQRAPLVSASNTGSKDLVKMLIDAKANLNEKDEYEWTALHTASVKGFADIVKMLIDAGASVNEKDKDGCTPLYMASFKGFADIVKMLIDAGANLDEKNKDGFSPLYIASFKKLTDVVKILIDAGANLDEKNKDEYTPLHLAIVKGFADIAKMLIDAKASLNEKNKDGCTPLHLAIVKGFADIAKKLIDAKAILNEKK